MIRFVTSALVMTAVFAALPPRPTAADEAAWAPLLNCADVNADGAVSVGDIYDVVGRFGTTYQSDGYMLLYDLDGKGAVSVGDIARVVLDFGAACPLVETQVAQATLAIDAYQDQSAAIADGYVQGTQNLPGHGVHFIKWSLVDGNFDIGEPEGLNYSADGELLAIYYIDPIWLPGHAAPPEGFDGAEDMWHDHPGLCQWQGPTGPMVG